MNQDSIFNYFIKNRDSISQQMFKDGAPYKKYQRFPQFLLPTPAVIPMTFSDTVMKRKSKREYAARPLTLQELSTFLFWSAGRIEEQSDKNKSQERRAYPSGGAKFPLELYILILRDGEVKRGVYHYSVETHALEHIITVDINAVLSQLAFHENFTKEGGLIVLFSFVKNRSIGKYGSLAYKLAFMESGHISQSMYLIASALDLACCGLGMSDGSGFNQTLEIDGTKEPVFYGIAVGVQKSV